MIFALISDVHGNLEALTAVMDDIKSNGKVEEILFLGDAVGYGANPNEVLQIIDRNCRIKLMGNHDYSALGLLDPAEFNAFARSGINFSVSVLSAESKHLLSTFRMSEQFGELLLVHATPDAPEKWNYCLSSAEAGRQFAAFTDPICFIAHSHQPIVYQQDTLGEVDVRVESDFILRNDCRYIVNIGSVGQPRDGDPRSCYVIFDTIAQRLQYRRVEYDIESAQAKMKSAELPTFLIERLAVGK